jgi:isoleucyl-tRNA synthetase
MRWLFASGVPEQNLGFPRIPSEEAAGTARGQGQPPRLSDRWMQVRAPLDKLWNMYSFFVTYANIDQFNPLTRSQSASDRSDLDCWALSELQETTLTVEAALSAFDARRACAAIADLIEDLSNWYVRRSRRRFWKSEEDADKVAAYQTLYECLVTVAKLLAPVTPFLAEALYQNLVRSVDTNAPESVHLCDWPTADASLISPQLRDETALVMRLVNLGRAAREKAQLRVRQPLSVVYVRVTSDVERASLQRLSGQILDELNVKRLEMLPPESDMLVYTVEPKMSVLGPKYGKLLPRLLGTLRSGGASTMQAAARELQETGRLRLTVDGQPIELLAAEVEIEARAREGYVAAEERGYVAVLETQLTPELLAEGLVRDLTHLVQDVRKRAGLAIEDTIDTRLLLDADLAEVVERDRSYISDETLTRNLTIAVRGSDTVKAVKRPANSYTETIPAAKLGGHEVVVTVRKHRL